MPLAVSLASCFRVDAPLPPTLVPGGYEVLLNNGLLPGDGVVIANVTVVPGRGPATGWPSATFQLGANCTSVAGCLAAARAAGGGIARIPAGAFAMGPNEVLDVSGRVQLLGAGANATLISWASNVAPAPPALVSCSGLGRIIGLGLIVTSAVNDAVRFEENSIGCALDNAAVTVDFTSAAAPIGNAFSAYNSSHWGVVGVSILHRGNCSRNWPLNTAFYIERSRDALVGSSTVVCACQGHSIDSSQRIFLDNLTVVSIGQVSQGDGLSTFEQPKVLEDIYEGRGVDIGNPDAAKRYESFTLDGPGGAALSYAASSSVDASGVETIVLANPPPVPDKYFGVAQGLAVVVIDGSGVGQVSRAITGSADARTWTVSPPFRAPLTLAGGGGGQGGPPSLLSIIPFRGGLTYEGNAMLNDTTWQLFGTALDVVSAGNFISDMSSGGTMTLWGLYYIDGQSAGGWQPNYNVLFDQNTAACSGGLGSLSIPGPVPPAPVVFDGAYNRLATLRRGAMLGGAGVSLQGVTRDCVVEQVAFEAAECGGRQVPAGAFSAAASTERIMYRP